MRVACDIGLVNGNRRDAHSLGHGYGLPAKGKGRSHVNHIWLEFSENFCQAKVRQGHSELLHVDSADSSDRKTKVLAGWRGGCQNNCLVAIGL